MLRFIDGFVVASWSGLLILSLSILYGWLPYSHERGIRLAAYNDTYVGTQAVTVCFPSVATRSSITAHIYTIPVGQLTVSKKGRFPLVSKNCAIIPMSELMEA